MKPVSSEKYSIAWFKLEEFVLRGEKERALGLFRLLSHTFDDKALTEQLEGDLLAAFNDDLSLKKYAQAADLYKQSDRLMQAAAVYETMLYKKPQDFFVANALFELYTSLGFAEHSVKMLDRLIQIQIDEKKERQQIRVFAKQALDHILNTVSNSISLDRFLKNVEERDQALYKELIDYCKR